MRELRRECMPIHEVRSGPALFHKLMADDSSALDAVATIALYRTHPELLPDGADGVALARALARRLAAVDLVDEASQLLRETLPKAPLEQQPEIGLDLASFPSRPKTRQAPWPRWIPPTSARSVPSCRQDERRRARRRWSGPIKG